MSYNPEELLNNFKGKKVKKSDKSTFFEKMGKFISLRYLKIMWHLIWNLECAKNVFNPIQITLIAAAVAYVVFPLDAVPDFIPVVGLLDDAAVMAFIVDSLGELLDTYEEMCM